MSHFTALQASLRVLQSCKAKCFIIQTADFTMIYDPKEAVTVHDCVNLR